MCLNFVQDGRCHATGAKCILGSRGATVSNEAGECELHGRFDVWVTERDELLMTDMGFPAEEPKQCLAMGINQNLAQKIVEDFAKQRKFTTKTAQHRCLKCQQLYWISEHESSSGLRKTGKGYFCPTCIREGDEDLEKRLGMLRHWCG